MTRLGSGTVDLGRGACSNPAKPGPSRPTRTGAKRVAAPEPRRRGTGLEQSRGNATGKHLPVDVGVVVPEKIATEVRDAIETAARRFVTELNEALDDFDFRLHLSTLDEPEDEHDALVHLERAVNFAAHLGMGIGALGATLAAPNSFRYLLVVDHEREPGEG